MIRKVLLCCRGEIAMRFIRTCRHLGIETIAAYPIDDVGAPYVTAANLSVPIQARTPSEAIPEVIAIARLTGADAIAPGYGPLAENAEFAELCVTEGFVFVGPNANAIRLSGDKIQARMAAEQAGASVIPGAMMPTDTNSCVSIARQIGFPVIVKAVLGGGGRGIRVAHTENEFISALQEVRREAHNAFGSDQAYVERFLGEQVRHIEVQVVADQHGRVVHLGDRECSVQRRRQKLVEEAPAPNLVDHIRQNLYLQATNLAKAIGYDSAGTVEFLVDPCGSFYFIEMNARIQVEHPVTESVCGVDIVEQMIRSACGQPLALDQDSIHFVGHAIEFRVCAEDPLENFLPAAGVASSYVVPEGPGIRIDSGITCGTVQSPRFDSLCTKIVVHGRDRSQALFRATDALREFRVTGFPTNVPFHRWLLRHPDFVCGTYNLGLMAEFIVTPAEKSAIRTELAIVAAISAFLREGIQPHAESTHKNMGASLWRLRNEPRSYVESF
ncbi:acetyl-CoA carboxylase biotin carboxylase subunit [Paraburkholderia ginsengisoli]|uniref:ATP-grasp domain-containing protein n=1 Tax=Paraburkholderia ginsengisoli TaxID=311231 RepID=A0A7T4N350_9BURK|nr:biotin carboxylase N-terminal domain-containing protein [Paraburkholderia ginsengisoli]QQC64388.1 ATP-grasp domain-containing protein [Paraburkholderia ginsengisoli]